MDFTKLDTFLSQMELRGVPACDLTVTVEGKTVYRGIYGYADAAKTRPASDRDMYYLYSLSKVALCTGALRALERGLIHLDDPVGDYLPAFRHLMVKRPDGSVTPAERVMTVRHLFSMAGGLDYDMRTPAINRVRDHGPTDTVSAVASFTGKPLLFEPGTSYEYSLCHDVLAAVVEVASGTRFAEYQQREIFDPLGMTDTTYHPTEEQTARISELWRYNESTYTPYVEDKNSVHLFILGDDYDSGGAGIVSSADSYLRLIAALSNGGTSVDGYQVLRPETIRLLAENQLCAAGLAKFAAGRFGGYGFGLCCRTHLRPEISLSPSSVGEFGWDSAANAYALVDPTRKIGIQYVTHVLGCVTGYYLYHPAIRGLVYEALEA